MHYFQLLPNIKLYIRSTTPRARRAFFPFLSFHPSRAFDSSHANAVREAARAQEAMNDEAELNRSEQAAEAAARSMVSQKAAKVAAAAAEAEAAARQVVFVRGYTQ